jgi:hypothetical protein
MELDELIIRVDVLSDKLVRVRYMFLSKLDSKEFRIRIPRPEMLLYIGLTILTAIIERWGKGNGRK